MSRSFNAYPTVAYIGIPYANSVHLGNRMGVAATLLFNWLAYGASSIKPNINVRVDLSGALVSQQLKKVRAIFIDNTGSDNPIYVYFPSTGYSVVAKPNSSVWFPVYTGDFVLWVIGLGFATGDIPTTTILVSNLDTIPSVDEEFGQAISLYRASPAIFFGGGAPLAAINPILSGQSYTSGALNVSGGGGSGATAHGVLDQFGRFVNVIVDTVGAGFTGPLVIVPTASNAARPAWNNSIGYAGGSIVTFNGTEWRATVAIPGPPPGGNPPPNTDARWLNSGTPGGTTATFSTVLGLPVSATSIFSPGYGAPSLGDQTFSVFDSLSSTGVFRNNLFGSPYGSGIITLTNFYAKLARGNATTSNLWKLDASDGSFIFQMADFVNGVFAADMSGMNVKLDATKTYRLNLTAFGTAGTILELAHTINYSYNPNGF
jgi:hypothetical protein